MTAFKTPATPDISPSERGLTSSNETHGEVDSKIELPYMDYETQNGHPYIVDLYELSDNWKDELGGFGEEVATIDSYIKNKIDLGEIANSQKAIKAELKKIEKLTGMDKEERVVMKLGNVAAYTKFLMESDNIKFNVRKYKNG